MFKIFFLPLLFCSEITWAAKHPLFKQSTETFRIVDATSKTPTFHILKDSLTKKALAKALNAHYGFKNSKGNDSVEVRLQKIIFGPSKNSKEKATITFIVSDHEFEITPEVNKKDLQTGKSILVQVPTEDQQFAVFRLLGKGNFTLQYLVKEDALLIKDGYARLWFENPLMSDEGSETLRFNGRGLRP